MRYPEPGGWGFHQTAPTPAAARVPGRDGRWRLLIRKPSRRAPKRLLCFHRDGSRHHPLGHVPGRPRARQCLCSAPGTPSGQRAGPGTDRRPEPAGDTLPPERLAPVTAHRAGRAPRSLAAAALGCHVAPPVPRWTSRPGRRCSGRPSESLWSPGGPAPDSLTEQPRNGADSDGGSSSVRVAAAGWPTWTRGMKQPCPAPASEPEEKRARRQRGYTAGACRAPPLAGTYWSLSSKALLVIGARRAPREALEGSEALGPCGDWLRKASPCQTQLGAEAQPTRAFVHSVLEQINT